MINIGLTILYEDLCPEWLKLCRDNGIFDLCIHKIAVPGADSIGELLAQLSAPGGFRLIDELNEAGVETPFQLHALEWLLPRELFADHPEWFRMDEDGKRTPDLNLCASSRPALDMISQRTYHLAGALKQRSNRYHLWLDDAKGGSCHCPDCKKLNSSDQYLKILSAILHGLRARNSKAELSFLSYGTVLDVPTKKPEKGIFLEFAPMDRDHDLPLNSPDLRGRKYIELLGKLEKVFDFAEAEVLEYWLDDALYSGYKRPPVKVPFNEEVCRADCVLYREAGFKTIRSFASFIGADYFELHGKPPIAEYVAAVVGGN
ncbi:MAG: DUF4838 domain-containing protein [Eubacteriales bacterium]|jgi:hypothetical protein